MAVKQKFLFVLTSCDQLGNTGEKTRFHYGEMTDPYYLLQEHDVGVELASINGSEPPADPSSLKNPPESVRKFLGDNAAMAKLKSTIKIDDVNMNDYAGIYMPGGHGTMWDFPDSVGLIKAIEDAWTRDKIVAAVCHGVVAFVNANDKNGQPLVMNRRINCFTDEEEQNEKKSEIVPFLLESRLRDLGALIEKEQPGQAHMVEDGNLVTGQNSKSAILVANGILRSMGISPYVEIEKDRKEVA